MIPLTKDASAIVDDEWYPILVRWRWYMATGYAIRDIGGRSARQHIWMHRYVVMAPDGWEVDHINGNKLDNRTSNLRLVEPHHQNYYNRPQQRNSTTGYKGVCFDKARNRFIAQIQFEGKVRRLGRFATAEEAACAYNEAAKQLFGEFAWLNEVPA